MSPLLSAMTLSVPVPPSNVEIAEKDGVEIESRAHVRQRVIPGVASGEDRRAAPDSEDPEEVVADADR